MNYAAWISIAPKWIPFIVSNSLTISRGLLGLDKTGKERQLTIREERARLFEVSSTTLLQNFILRAYIDDGLPSFSWYSHRFHATALTATKRTLQEKQTICRLDR